MLTAAMMGLSLLAPMRDCALGATAATTDLYVGFAGTAGNYGTVQAAVNAAAKVNPTSEAQRVTIHIAPGTYREPVCVKTPYLSFVNDTPSQQVLLTWYYGIGYRYYSVGSDGRYSASAAASKSAKAEPTNRWGCAVELQRDADFFRAENITFENSFNRYVTSEELADGVSLSGSQKITFERKAGADVRTKAATERGAAMAIDADNCEFYHCQFFGSQDTLYAGGASGYFKECKIAGNTDYIFGQGDYVFDTCELQFAGYSAGAVGGYLTAARPATHGYLFTDCRVTASDLTVSPGYFGRPWGTDATVAFVNTTLAYESILQSAGWYSMSGVDPAQAKFREYHTTANGKAVDVSKRPANTLLSSASGYTLSDYLGSWKPYYSSLSNPPVPGQKTTVFDPSGTAIGSYSSTLSFADGFSVTASTEKPIEIAENTLSSANGSALPNRVVRLGGGGDLSYRSLCMEAAGAGALSIRMMSSNAQTPRTVQLLDRNGVMVSEQTNVIGSSLQTYSFAVPAAGTYYLASSASGLNLYDATLSVQEAEAPPSYTCGDLDENGVINALDLALLKTGLLTGEWRSPALQAAADVDGNHKVDALDCKRMQEYLTRTSESLALYTGILA